VKANALDSTISEAYISIKVESPTFNTPQIIYHVEIDVDISSPTPDVTSILYTLEWNC